MDILAPKFQAGVLLAAGLCTICLFAFWCFVGMSEWWSVVIEKKANNYIFNGNPWYYESGQLYSKVMLIEGIVMLALTSGTIYLLFKRKKTVYYVLILGICYSFLRIVYGQAV